MAVNEKSPGTTVNYSNTGSAIAAGAAVVVGNRIGIAINDIAATSGTGPVKMVGEQLVTKATGSAWAIGDPIYFDESAVSFSPIPGSSSKFAGLAWRAAASGDTTGYVALGIGQRQGLDVNHVATTPTTLTRADVGKLYTNLGASGTIVFNLPQVAYVGDYYDFTAMAAQVIEIDPGAAGAFYIGGAKQTDDKKISFDDEGESVRVIADGNGDWIAINYIGTVSVEA